MRKPRTQELDLSGWTPVEIDNSVEMTLFIAVEQITAVFNDSQLNDLAYKVAERPISYIVDLLGFTQRQALVYAIVMNIYYDRQISTFDIARSLDITPIKALPFDGDLEELCNRNYLRRNLNDDSLDKTYKVTREAIESLRNNCAVVSESAKVNSCEEWFSALDKIVTARCNERIDYATLCVSIDKLISENEKLPVIKRYMSRAGSLSVVDRMLFMWVCNMVVNDNFERVVPENFKKLYEDSMTYRMQRKSLASGSNDLVRKGLLRVATSTEQRSRDCYELTPWVVKEMLAEMEIEMVPSANKDLIAHTSITPKQLYYNEKEQRSIDRLAALLQPTRFAQVRDELKKQGFRSGFACLFYGAPGTGKTETVMQLARATGRDLMQVNISEIKSMWVGESEKNIKAIFSHYRKLVEESEVAPILLFNEADAIIGKRLENVSRSVDKMENAMQNIILEEFERLEGILIATTNLTCNMDSAFERRFLYKVEFERPSVEVKSAIWQSMISELTVDDAISLSSKYDFSGGQIENVARKSIVDRILSGDDLSLDTLYTHCDAELLGKSVNKRKIGY